MRKRNPCAICDEPATAADHCHKTGAVRDWLCVRCNAGLGFYRDNPGLLRKAARYIELHRRRKAVVRVANNREARRELLKRKPCKLKTPLGFRRMNDGVPEGWRCWAA